MDVANQSGIEPYCSARASGTLDYMEPFKRCRKATSCPSALSRASVGRGAALGSPLPPCQPLLRVGQLPTLPRPQLISRVFQPLLLTVKPFKQLRFSPHPQFMNLRAFDFEDAQWKINGPHSNLRNSCSAFVDGAALDQSEASVLELMDLVLERENAYPVVAEYNTAEAEWNQWLEDEERAFVALCVCPVHSPGEARQKQAVVRACPVAELANGEAWFEALVSSIA